MGIYTEPRPALEVPPTEASIGARLHSMHGSSDPAPAGPPNMHPADLADHRARRRAQELNALERDATRLAPVLSEDDAYALRCLLDGAHDGSVDITVASATVRKQLSTAARQSAA